MAGPQADSNRSNDDATIKTFLNIFTLSQCFYFSCTVTRASAVTDMCYTSIHRATPLSPRDWFNHNMLLRRQWATLPAQMVKSVGIGPCGVRRIQLPSITDKYSPVKRLFPFKWWHENKSLISTTGPSRSAQPHLCLLNLSGSSVCLALYPG